MISETGSQRINFCRSHLEFGTFLLDMTIIKETDGFFNENEALHGGLRGGYYGGYFEHLVIRDMSYGVWA